MKKEKQIEIIEKVLAELKASEKHAVEGITATIDTDRYRNPERFHEEKETLFKRLPIVIGAASSLEKAGDYFLYDHLEVPLIAVKGNTGQIRVFLNVCRHRAVKLVTEPKGNIRRTIVCPYHAWSYDLDGCLQSVFHPVGFSGVDANSHSLLEVDSWVRFGMLFVVPDHSIKGQIEIDTWLDEVYSLTEGFDFGSLIAHLHSEDTLPFNWKLLVDGALEGYHFKIAHSQTIGPYFLDNKSIPLPTKTHSSIVFPKKSLVKLQQQPKEKWELREVANVLIHVFPNVVLLIEPDHIMVVTFCPRSPTETHYHAFMLLPKSVANEKEASYWSRNEKIFWDAIHEDNEMAALQQRSFSGQSDLSITVGGFEPLLLQFEQLVDRLLNK